MKNPNNDTSVITTPLEIITEDNTDIPQSSPNTITSEQSNLTTNRENRNELKVTKINHPSEINRNNSHNTRKKQYRKRNHTD